MGFLANKRILITGMISNRSIAYGVAVAMHREGAQLAFTYQGDLQFGGSPVSGSYDMTFTCYNSATGGQVIGKTITKAIVAARLHIKKQSTESLRNIRALIAKDLCARTP